MANTSGLTITDTLGRAIRAAGAHLIFLPAYSPDLNPIEQPFAKLQHLMRAAQPRAVKEAGERPER